LKSDNSTLMSPIAISLIEAKNPNTPNSTIVDTINVIVVKFGVRAHKQWVRVALGSLDHNL
jgi:hypothetical protein